MKLSSLYLSITLIVTIVIDNFCHASGFHTLFHVESTSEAIAFWTPEKIKEANPHKISSVKSSDAKFPGFGNVIFQSNSTVDARSFWTPERPRSVNHSPHSNRKNETKRNEDKKNTKRQDPTDRKPPLENEVEGVNYPVGMFYYTNSKLEVGSCTASMINTDNGNIGITSPNCLVGKDKKPNTHLVYSPGYDDEKIGPLELIAVEEVLAADGYGLFRLKFEDPSGKGLKVQQYTGAFGWDFRSLDRSVGVSVNVLGYPNGEDLIPNCLGDGVRICRWEGVASMNENNYVVKANFGQNIRGCPYVFRYDKRTNLGYFHSQIVFFDEKLSKSSGPVMKKEDFLESLKQISE